MSRVLAAVILCSLLLIVPLEGAVSCGAYECVPGVENLGRGYDLVKGELKLANVVDLETPLSTVTYTSPYKNKTYGIPPVVNVVNTPSYDVDSELFRSSVDFASHKFVFFFCFFFFGCCSSCCALALDSSLTFSSYSSLFFFFLIAFFFFFFFFFFFRSLEVGVVFGADWDAGSLALDVGVQKVTDVLKTGDSVVTFTRELQVINLSFPFSPLFSPFLIPFSPFRVFTLLNLLPMTN